MTTVDDELDEADEAFTLTLSGAGNATLSGGGSTLAVTGTITDGDALSAKVTADAPSVNEGSDALFTVRLEGARSTADVVVDYAVDASATATAGTDYTAPSGTLTITSGQPSGQITIATLDTDDVLDPGETLVVKLTGATSDGRLVTVDATATVETEITDGGAVNVSVGNAEKDEGETVSFSVKLSGAVGSVVEVSYSTSHDTGAGDASASDYTGASGRLTFSPGGALTQTIAVATAEDTLDEPDEAFTLTLTRVKAPLGVTVQSTGATGTIRDDDEPPQLTVAAVTVTEGSDAEFAVELGAASGREVTVSYATADDTAQQPGDYARATGTLTFSPGEPLRQTITVTTVDDELDEAG